MQLLTQELIYWREDILKWILTAASTLAGDSSFGSLIIEMTDNKIVSTVCMGSHLSSARSYPNLSSPGSWSIDMHTSPSFDTR